MCAMTVKHTPAELKLHRNSRLLEITFDDGTRFQLPCEYLRVYSPSAEVRGHGPGTWKLELGKENVTISELLPVGRYAVKIVFDDGHDSGLYDWNYLYKLGSKRRDLWALYLERLARAGESRAAPDPFEELE